MGGVIYREKDRNDSQQKVNERDLNEYYECEMEDSHSHKYKRALVVDDSKFNRKMLSRTINDFFEDVVLAEDGAEAVELIKVSIANSAPYDIIFMDSIMPVMGGIEATARIRDLGYDSLIIGVTGDITEEDADKFVKCGVNDVMLKPLLLPHVESILIDLKALKNGEVSMTSNPAKRVSAFSIYTELEEKPISSTAVDQSKKRIKKKESCEDIRG